MAKLQEQALLQMNFPNQETQDKPGHNRPGEDELTPFGHPMRKRFLFEKRYINFNHGRPSVHLVLQCGSLSADRFIRDISIGDS
jgi:hypothetical protein